MSNQFLLPLNFGRAVLAGVLAGALPWAAAQTASPAPASQGNANLAVKTLTEQARFWEAKGRGDLATAAWKRLLQVDPKNTDAISALAQFEVDNNRPEAAKALVEKLKTQPAAPNANAAIQRIEGAVAMKSVNAQVLEQARSAAKAGRTEEAVGLYRQLFDGQPIRGPLALEYYQTLGGLSNAWDDARKGLETLATGEPNNARANLAYAQHLTYRASTRREGINRLAQLARQSSVSVAAIESWRKALTWLEASKADTPLFQAFLSVKPGDAAIQARIASLNQVAPPKPLDPQILALRDGFTALNSGDVVAAEKRFQGLLNANPRNPDALGGLGVIRLKQERFADAERLLSEATRLSGSRKWTEALGASRFWLALKEGDRAAAAGDIAAARRSYEQAARIDPGQQRPQAALADLLVDEGRLIDAEQAYRQGLARYPKSLELRRGLAGVLIRQDKVDEALVLADGLTEAERIELGYGSLKAEQFRARAGQMLAAGNPIGAMQQLEEALLWDPNSPWLRLELARLYNQAGATNEAFGLMDGLLQTHPDMPDALHAAALMSVEAKEWAIAMSMLEKIPANARTREMTDLQRRLWVRAQLANAASLTKAGQGARAAQILDQAQSAAGNDAALLADVAQAVLELGDESRSINMMRALLAQNPQPSPGLLAQYAALLLRTRQDVELAAQLRQLYGMPLSAQQRSDVDAMRWAYSLRQVDAQREAGNLSAAYEIAAQLLREKPSDASAQQVLARVYSSAGEHKMALAWYHQLLQQSSADVPTLLAASGAALAAGELSYAQSALNTAVRMAPSDPAVLAAMGRLARAQGKNRQAVDLLQQAQQMTLAQAQAERAGPLGVNLVDYTLPPPPVVSSQAASNAVPLIPNPLGGRFVAPSVQPRPLMQQLPPSFQPPRQPAQPIQPSVQPAQRMQPLSQWPSVPGAAGAPVAAAQMDDQPVTGNPFMRPVQYQLPRRETSVFDVPPPATAPAAPMVPSRPMLTPVAPQSGYAAPNAAYQPYQPAPSAPAYAPTYPAPAYPNAVAQADAYPVQAAPRFNPQPSASVLGYSGGATGQATAASPQNALPAEPLLPSGWAMPTRAAPDARRAPSAPGSLQREIDELRASRSGFLGGGGAWRGRTGDAGTSELTDFSLAVEGRFSAGEAGQLVLRMEPVFLSAGRVSSSNLNTFQQFGTNAETLLNVTGFTNREQQDSGVALSVGYETARLKMDFGVTPLGFEVQNIVGGIAYNDALGDLKFKLDVSRRPVTDSLLSYAGTVDDLSGTTWGGVTATGGRLELGVEEGPFGLYGYGGFHFLRGRNVVNNTRFEVGGGAYYKLIQDADMELTTGVSITALGYNRNLRYFTLGHGGYFSPQRYFSLSLPVEWAGRSGNMSYRLDGSIGLQSFRENSVAYYPGDTTRQTNWETVAASSAAAAPTGVTLRTFYPGQSKTGLGFRLGGEAEYRFAPQWTVGGKVAIDNASNYTQTTGAVYVRYHFDPIYTSIAFPPKPLKVGQ